MLSSAVDTAAQEKIQAFVAKFGKLRDEYNSRVGTQALVVVQTESKPARYDGNDIG
jgi:hypothetical protein